MPKKGKPAAKPVKSVKSPPDVLKDGTKAKRVKSLDNLLAPNNPLRVPPVVEDGKVKKVVSLLPIPPKDEVIEHARPCERPLSAVVNVVLKYEQEGVNLVKSKGPEAELTNEIFDAPAIGPFKRLVKNWKDGSIQVGDSLFYRGERWWVEWVPESWDKGSFVHLSDVKIEPLPGRLPSNKRSTVCVFADLLVAAPTKHGGTGPQPTVKAVERAERAKTGQTDVGDPVADLLRAAKDLDDMYAIAAKYLKTTPADLKGKYGHLNPGQQRMNCGNRMRAQWKKSQQTFAK